jgi:hypothetical protein
MSEHEMDDENLNQEDENKYVPMDLKPFVETPLRINSNLRKP